MQNDEPSTHAPPLQSLEQHWSFVVQALPAVLQVPFSGWQAPDTH
jgi:hypothetical protein